MVSIHSRVPKLVIEAAAAKSVQQTSHIRRSRSLGLGVPETLLEHVGGDKPDTEYAHVTSPIFVCR